jgi:hypothetical protein
MRHLYGLAARHVVIPRAFADLSRGGNRVSARCKAPGVRRKPGKTRAVA